MLKNVLVSILLLATAISCTSSSSSSPEPVPAGKDGVKEFGDNIAFGDKNGGMIPIDEPGKDLVLAIAYPLGAQSGQLRVTELETDLEAQIKIKFPEPRDDKTKAALETVCFLSNTPHHWMIKLHNVETRFNPNEVVGFDFDSVMYLAIETRTKPKCEKFFFNFSSELMNAVNKPQPTPPPTPTPAPPIPKGSESVQVLPPVGPDHFSITSDKADGRNFKINVSMLIDGVQFAQTVLVEKIFVNIFDKQSNSYVSEWTPIVENAQASPLPASYRLEFTLDKFSAPAYFMDRKKDMVLTFMINSTENSPLPVRSVELDKYK